MLADRCIQNIYRRLRQDAGPSKEYPGVLASLLLLDKLSIEDIKASITELMAGGVDTVINEEEKSFVSSSPEVFFFCLSDLHNPAVDLI